MVAEKGDKKGANKSDLKMCCQEKPFARVLLLVMAATLLLAFVPQPALADTAITTCTELQNIRDNLAGNYYLGNDIDCTGTSGWNGGAGFEPIGTSCSNNFTGTFDGQGYKITGLYINLPSSDYAGLFGFTGPGSKITNVSLEQVIVNGYWHVGGLVGRTKDGQIANCYSTGNVKGDSHVGGLVGRIERGTITNCYSTCSVNGDWQHVGGLVGRNEGGQITKSYSTGSVNGDSHVGGLVGRNEGSGATIANSYSIGSVSGTSAVGGLVGWNGWNGATENSYSTGRVHGNECAGGLVGKIEGGQINNSYWDIITSGQSSSAGGEGKTTAEMKQQATFENWDFVNIWALVDFVSYPYLQWQPEPPISVPVFSITGLVVVIGMMCIALAVAVSRRRR